MGLSGMEEEINALEERKTEMPNLSNRGKCTLKREREKELQGPVGPCNGRSNIMSLEFWKKRAVVKKHSQK